MCGDDADGDRNETPAPRRAKRSKASYTHAPAHAGSTLAGQAPRDEWAVAAREAEAVLQAQALEVPVQAVAGCMPALHLQRCSFPAAADYLPQGPMPDPRVNFGEQLLPGAAAACLAAEQAAKPVPAAAAAAGGWGGRIKIEGQPPRCKAEEEAESTETSGGSCSSSGGSSRGCSVPSLGTLRAAMEYNEAVGPVASDPNAPLFQVTMPGVPSTGAELLLPPGVDGKAACMGAAERMLQPVSDDVAARESAGLLGLEAISKREREDSDDDMPESAFGGLEGALDADDAGMQHVRLEAAGALLGAGLPGPQASLHTSQDVALAEPAAAVAVAEEPVPEQPVLKLLEMMASFCGAVLHEPEQGLHGGASPHARLLVHMLNALPRGELAQDGAMATELLHASERLVGLPRGALADRYWSASPHVSAYEGHYSRCGSKAGSQNA